ncbi:hypothetical protein LPJ57_000637 [Coemansia sp. RSA 486]|nr:hypothetical protein LPJ57_000637 [Coemansia sp. RSA 486]
MQLNAVHKRRDLHTAENFSEITKQFNKDLPGCDLLTELVHSLRSTLVNSEVENAPQGTMLIDTTRSRQKSLMELRKIMQSPTGYDNLTTPTKRPSSKQPALTRGGVSTGAAPIPSVGPAKTTVNTDSDTNDPIAKRVGYASLISEELLEVVEIFSHLVKKAIAAHAA